MICVRCGHEILPGQLRRNYPVWEFPGQPSHIACPTPREVQIAHRWRRWT